MKTVRENNTVASAIGPDDPPFSTSVALQVANGVAVRSKLQSCASPRNSSKPAWPKLEAQRLTHPALLVFLLGEFVSSGVNLFVTSLLHFVIGLNPLVAFFLGTICNVLLHVAYYSFLFVNRKAQLRPHVFGQLLAFFCAAAGSSCLVVLLLFMWKLDFAISVSVSIVVLSLLNTLLARSSTFGSAELAHIEYRDMPGTFYADQIDSTKVGRLRAWFHVSRFRKLNRFVAAYYQPGMQIADLGCGNCLWNTDPLPVMGVDMNPNMMRWALRHGCLQSYRVSDDLAVTGLSDKSFDIVVMSETLEHLLQLGEVLSEVKRILRDDGHFLITVPYDIFLGPFFVLFNVSCVYQAYVKGSKYHKFRCGHIHHFSVRRLRSTLAEAGLHLETYQVVNGLTLFASAVKSPTR